MAKFAHNSRIHSSTGSLPFYVNKGFHLNLGMGVGYQMTTESSDFIKMTGKKVGKRLRLNLKGLVDL